MRDTINFLNFNVIFPVVYLVEAHFLFILCYEGIELFVFQCLFALLGGFSIFDIRNSDLDRRDLVVCLRIWHLRRALVNFSYDNIKEV